MSQKTIQVLLENKLYFFPLFKKTERREKVNGLLREYLFSKDATAVAVFQINVKASFVNFCSF